MHTLTSHVQSIKLHEEGDRHKASVQRRLKQSRDSVVDKEMATARERKMLNDLNKVQPSTASCKYKSFV